VKDYRSPIRSKLEEELVSFLESPASYPDKPQAVRVLQTHISWVFIAAPLVFKVKKPVNLGFLDFSTLEKRRYFCQLELFLNRRLSPDVYSLQANGEAAEYSVKMKELPWIKNSTGP